MRIIIYIFAVLLFAFSASSALADDNHIIGNVAGNEGGQILYEETETSYPRYHPLGRDGNYYLILPDGTYNILVIAPNGLDVISEKKNVKIDTHQEINFEEPSIQNEISKYLNNTYLLIGFLLLGIFIVLVLLIRSRK